MFPIVKLYEVTYSLCMDKIELKIMNWNTFDEEYNENYEFVEAYLQLEYKNKYIGYYSLLFNFLEESFDDYFNLVRKVCLYPKIA